MSQIAPFLSTTNLSPALVAASGKNAQLRFLEFFIANIRNPNTRRAYAQAVWEFLGWCEMEGVGSISAIQPVHVAAFIELLARERSAPTAKQRLAGIRHLFDWLVIEPCGQQANPAASVRGPTHIVKKGKTPVLSPKEARRLLESIDVNTQVGLRDRALIGLMIYSLRPHRRRALNEGRKISTFRTAASGCGCTKRAASCMTCLCHHNLESYLEAYLNGVGISRQDLKGPLFRTSLGALHVCLSRTPLPQANAYAMIRRKGSRRRYQNPHWQPHISATGITAYLKNGGTLEQAAAMANHASTRTTQPL